MIRLNLFGGSDLVGPDGRVVVPVLSQPKRLAVLAYLALAGPGKFRTRDTVLALFWPEATEAGARRALNQTLHFLRRWLGAETIVSRGPSDLGVPSEALWCDVVEFDRLIKRDELTAALNLYDGDLLAGFFSEAGEEFDQWLSGERARLRRLASAGAWRSAKTAEESGQIAAAVEWGRRGLELSQNDESSARALIQLLSRAGDKSGAIQAYSAFAAQLANEYGAEPSPETRAVVSQMRSLVISPTSSAGSDVGVGSERNRVPGNSARKESPGIPNPEPSDAASGRTGDGDLLAGRGRRPRSHWRLRAGGVLLSALGVVVLASFANQRRMARSEMGTAVRPVITVKPLESAISSASPSHLPSLLTAAVIDRLAHVRSFDVIAGRVRERAPKLSGEPAVPAIVVAGTVSEFGDVVRVNVEVSDAVSGRVIKSATLNGALNESLLLVDTLSRRISSLVRAAVGHEVRMRAWAASTNNPRVFTLMQQADEQSDRATELIRSGEITTAAKALWSSDSSLGEAERMAPHNSDLLVERAHVLNRLSTMYFNAPFSRRDGAISLSKRGIVAADRAVETSPSDASALEASGSAWYWYWLLLPPSSDSSDVVLARAERQLRGAVNIDPQRASAWSLLSTLLVSRNDQSGAYLAASRAYDADAFMDNRQQILNELFLTSYEMGNDSLAARWCHQLNRGPEQSWAGAHCQLALLAWNGVKGEQVIPQAWRIANGGSLRVAGNHAVSPYLQMLVAAIIARNGLADSASAVIRRAQAVGGADPELAPFEADARVRLGEIDSATALMIQYVNARPRRRIWLARSRRFAKLTQLQEQLANVRYPTSMR